MPPMRPSASRPAQSASLSSGRRLTPRRFALRSSVRLSELGELGLLAELERRGLAERIENDAAQLGDGLVVTQDSLVEGVHFRLDRLSWRELGFRAAAVNISDLAASGADPDALVVSLAVPAEVDSTAAPTVVITATAVGVSARVPGRGGARPGDLLVVTGPLGGAGAAFRV